METSQGNTKIRLVPSKYWCFTLNNWLEEEYNNILEILLTKKMCWIIGKEIGENGTPHLQGYIESKIKIRPSECFNNKRIHWEKRKGSRDDNIKYCSKDGKYECNGLIVKKPLIDPMDEVEWYDWQCEILSIILNKVDNRKIYWYWDNDGCKGKTSLAKHLCMKYNAILLSGKGSDCKHGIITHMQTHKEIDIAIFHFSRSVEDYVSYESIESIKDGIFFSGKYESGMCIFNAPHIICFANFAPNLRMLSEDRWVVKEII